MNYYILLIIFLIFILLFIIYKTNTYECLSDSTIRVPPASTTLPITPDLSSNQPLGQYSNKLENNPERISKERQDVKENKSYSVQPKDLFFDIFNINCSQPFGRPWACLLMKGNYVNNLPIENCRRVCPEKFAEEENSSKMEGFQDFIEENPTPSHYWCITPCKKSCSKKKYNPLEPWKNTCGQNGFSQVPLNVYLSKEDCEKDNFPCEADNKEECLLSSKCGWCTNNSGKGFCFEGTTEGPLDPTIPCVPDREKGTNAYFKGNEDPFKGVQQTY